MADEVFLPMKTPIVCVGLIAGGFRVWAIVASAENDVPHGFFMPFTVGLITGAPLAVIGLLGIAGPHCVRRRCSA